MAIEGALQDVSLADICQLLSMGRKTGCLTMTDRSNFGYIYFESGRVIYASVLTPLFMPPWVTPVRYCQMLWMRRERIRRFHAAFFISPSMN